MNEKLLGTIRITRRFSIVIEFADKFSIFWGIPQFQAIHMDMNTFRVVNTNKNVKILKLKIKINALYSNPRIKSHYFHTFFHLF